MKKFKKFLLSVLSLALVAVLSIGGTLAYLKSEDSDVNVMTMGNVKIAQHEYERATNNDGSYKTDTIDKQTSYVLKEFTQLKPLLPIVGDPSTGEAGWDDTTVRMTQVDSYGGMQVFAGKVAQDKFVTVENTGKNDAYIRTLVAIEVGTADEDLIGISYHLTWTTNGIGKFTANGTTYYLYEFMYNGAAGVRHENGVLPAGDTSYPNLSQVYLKSETENEDIEAIDGNANGKLDILVLSQAVQTSGFANSKEALDRAFGETTTAKAAEWFNGMTFEKTVKNLDELKSAITEDAEIILGNDIAPSDTETKKYVHNYSNVVIEGKDNELALGDSANYGFFSNAGSTTIINEVNFEFAGGGIVARGGAKVTFNSGSASILSEQTSHRHMFYIYGEGTEVVVNDGEFSIDEYRKRTYGYAADNAKLIINGGTFGKAPNHPKDANKPFMTEAGGQVIINGGTFGFDPTEWVAAGHTVVNNGNGTWTVQ